MPNELEKLLNVLLKGSWTSIIKACHPKTHPKLTPQWKTHVYSCRRCMERLEADTGRLETLLKRLERAQSQLRSQKDKLR